MIKTNEELGYELIRSNECIICGKKRLSILLNYIGERERGRGRKGEREGEREKEREREEGKERERGRERGGDEGGGRKEALHSW